MQTMQNQLGCPDSSRIDTSYCKALVFHHAVPTLGCNLCSYQSPASIDRQTHSRPHLLSDQHSVDEGKQRGSGHPLY